MLLVVLGHLLVEVLRGGRDEAEVGQVSGAVLGLVVVPQLGCRKERRGSEGEGNGTSPLPG